MVKKKEYIVCPFCGWNKVLESTKRGEKGKSEEFHWPVIDLKRAYILQVREGGGKKGGSGAKGRGKAPGSGFHIIPSESLTLTQVIESHSYDYILTEMKVQLLELVRQVIALGWINEEDIKT